MSKTVDFDYKAYHRQRTERLHRERVAYQQLWLVKVKKAVAEVVADFPTIHKVYLFGSLLRPQRFNEGSDIDLAVVCADIRAETPFWRRLEQRLQRSVDVRPMVDTLVDVVLSEGMLLYEREKSATPATNSTGYSGYRADLHRVDEPFD